MTKQELMDLGLSEEAADKLLKEHVPYDRFKQVNDDKKALEGQLKERDTAIEGLNANTLKLTVSHDTTATPPFRGRLFVYPQIISHNI